MSESIYRTELIAGKIRLAVVAIAMASALFANICFVLHSLVVHGDLESLGSLVAEQALIGLGSLAVTFGASLLVARPLVRYVEAQPLDQIEAHDRVLARKSEELEDGIAERTRDLRKLTESLYATNAQLEGEILEREQVEKEQEDLNARLLKSTHQAGMAEVATDVLHNVGNVLNSINISVQLLKDQAKQSKVVELGRAMKMIPEAKEELIPFLAEDRKGSKLIPYLQKVSGVLTSERERLLSDILKLTDDVDHIKHIISMQQDYARSGNKLDLISPVAVILDSIRMNRVSLERHDVAIDFEAPEIPEMRLDRHKLLQILVNLIRNAKQAMAGLELERKKVAIDVRYGEDGLVQVSVADKGAGISAENMGNLFKHGFTTKSDGHGFGLHSCQISAKAMGGTLTATSEGEGRGATFVLEFPAELDDAPVSAKDAGGEEPRVSDPPVRI